MEAYQVRSIETAPTEHSYSEFMKVALGIGAIGLMLPVLVFVVTSTRLAAARREERLAALRLVGATPGQVNIIAAVEAVLAAIVGTVVGFGLFYAFRPLVARIPFTGEPFFTGDLSLGWLSITGVAIGVPVAAVLASLWTLRRVQISPLGVTRKAPPKRPHAIRLLAPVVAVALLSRARPHQQRAGEELQRLRGVRRDRAQHHDRRTMAHVSGEPGAGRACPPRFHPHRRAPAGERLPPGLQGHQWPGAGGLHRHGLRDHSGQRYDRI